jgi:undecaprenyl-diphosphatase
VTELFPVSSLGHSVIVPALIGGRWAHDLDVSAPESPYLAFIVGLHVATALALLIFFWKDWVRIIGGFLTSVRDRRILTPDLKLAWLLIIATIPVGVAGLLLEHTFRTVLGKPVPAALFLAANGVVLYAGELLRRRAVKRADTVTMSVEEERLSPDVASDRRLSTLGWGEGILIGAAEILALLPGISRSGATMVAGLTCGLSHEDAARFSFLLATPVILVGHVQPQRQHSVAVALRQVLQRLGVTGGRGHNVQPAIHHERRRVIPFLDEPQHGRTDLIDSANRRMRACPKAYEPIQVPRGLTVQSQGPRQGSDHLIGWMAFPPLLQPDVVLAAHAGQHGHFSAPQSGRPAPANVHSAPPGRCSSPAVGRGGNPPDACRGPCHQATR